MNNILYLKQNEKVTRKNVKPGIDNRKLRQN